MFLINPFAMLAETVPAVLMQSFVFVMVALVVVGTLLDIIHKKNVKYFFENAKKAKLSAKKPLSSSEKISVLFKDKKVESMVISVVLVESQIGLLMLGSYDRSKYLGDEDTTFIEYIRDVLEKKLSK